MSDVIRMTDAEGVVWDVEEVSRLQDPYGNGATAVAHPSWLAFRSHHEIRLLHPYPRDWENFSQDELRLLFRGATLHTRGS